jgi:hypothetical protein
MKNRPTNMIPAGMSWILSYDQYITHKAKEVTYSERNEPLLMAFRHRGRNAILDRYQYPAAKRVRRHQR